MRLTPHGHAALLHVIASPLHVIASVLHVIASAAKQSILSYRGKMDCFAPLAMTTDSVACRAVPSPPHVIASLLHVIASALHVIASVLHVIASAAKQSILSL